MKAMFADLVYMQPFAQMGRETKRPFFERRGLKEALQGKKQIDSSAKEQERAITQKQMKRENPFLCYLRDKKVSLFFFAPNEKKEWKIWSSHFLLRQEKYYSLWEIKMGKVADLKLVL